MFRRLSLPVVAVMYTEEQQISSVWEEKSRIDAHLGHVFSGRVQCDSHRPDCRCAWWVVLLCLCEFECHCWCLLCCNPHHTHISASKLSKLSSLCPFGWLNGRNVPKQQLTLYECETVPLPTVTSLVVFKNTVGSKSQSVLVKMHLFLLINRCFYYELYRQHCSLCEKRCIWECGWCHFCFN